MASYYRFFYWWAGHMGVSTYNLGYSPISDVATAGISCTEPFQLELYRQIAFALHPVRLRGRRVLEISCGLGGGFAHLVQHYGIGFGVVLDRSINAVRWARRRFGLHAINADARMLPLADRSFDAIINVEASHEYFSDRFVSEIARVLVPNGLFGMADLRYATSDLIEAAMRYDLARHGLYLIEFLDVTRNVVEACELDAPRRESLLTKVPWPVRGLIRPWIGLNDSNNYQQLRDRCATYFILVAERRNDASRVSVSG
ncbi:class I SAM-dependent methyltransferase, partial [Reyranella sp.]|uniref:class I SAM-dependent methyltransferase n=1 Tax=Reyranella sp. TaxID=1929291 RepID=UPI003D0C0A9E